MSQLDELKNTPRLLLIPAILNRLKVCTPGCDHQPLAGAEGRAAAAVSAADCRCDWQGTPPGGSAETQLINACDQVAVDIGSEVLRHVPGRISTEVDARFAQDRGMCVAKARKLIQLYEKMALVPSGF